MRRSTTALVTCALLALLATLAAPLASAQQRSVTWNRYDVDIAVQTDGSLAIAETQTIQFQGTYQQGFRVIPTDRTTGIDSVSVGEVVNGQPLAYRESTSQATNTFRTATTDQGLRVDWSFAPTTNAARTFVLRYVAHGAVRIYDAGDQAQWKAIYADRPGAVSASTVTVHLPADVDPASVITSFSRYTTQSPQGALPSDGTGQVVDARTVQFSIGGLPQGVGAEVRVQFPHGIVKAAPPPWQADADRADWVQQSLAPIGNFLALLLAVGVLAVGGTALFLAWYTRGRDPSPGAVPAVLDGPPSNLPAPLAGTLVDGVADPQDAVATLVDLAQRGVVTLTDETNPQLSGSSHDLRVDLHSAVEAPGLRPYERILLGVLFARETDGGQSVRLSNVRGHFIASIPMIQDALHRAVAEAGLFYRDPDAVRRRYRQLGWVVVGVGLVAAVAAVLVIGWAIGLAWLPGLALALVGGACVVLGRAMPRRTAAGALEAARWRAFRTHLMHSNAATQPEFLPYAVAFGLDRTFLRRLESVGWSAPNWYPGGAGRGWGAPGGVIVLPGGGWGGGPYWGGAAHNGDTNAGAGTPGGIGTPTAPPSPQGWSDGLADLLNAASEAMAHGGGSGGWSGGGFGGGGGGGGGSGGFS